MHFQKIWGNQKNHKPTQTQKVSETMNWKEEEINTLEMINQKSKV